MADIVFPVSRPHISKLEEEHVLDAVRSGWVSSLGPYINAFEEHFARFCGVQYALTTSNGTTCLHLALAALGLGPGDEVIVPDLTFVATANAVTYTGAKPILVDIDPNTLCVTADTIRPAITSRTRAVIPVHLYGHPADMDPINELAARHNLAVVEDAAEAHGAEYKGRRVGGLGRCGVFSFYGNKIITSGEGGVLTTNDEDLYRRAKRLRDHAMSEERRYWHPEVGFNYRMTNLQAALGLAQLKQIDQFLYRRQEIMQWYRDAIQVSNGVRLNQIAPWAKSVHWMVCLEVDWFDDEIRNAFMRTLKARGVDSRPYFYPLSTMPMYKDDPRPAAALKSAIGVNLPTYFDLSEADVAKIGDVVNTVLRELGPH